MQQPRRTHSRLWAWALAACALALLPGCSNDCIDLCQQYDLYLKDCGYGWSTAFPDKGWASIDDCYDEHWEVTTAQEARCVETAEEYDDLACY